MQKTVLTFGALAGLVIIIYTYGFLMILGDFGRMTPKDLEMAEWLGYVRYLVLLLGIVMAMIQYRRDSAGPISYGAAFKVGLMVALVTAVCVGLMESIYIAFINPDFFEQYRRLMMESLQARNASATEIREAQEQFETLLPFMQHPVATGLFYFVETTVIGTILALIGAIFTRRPTAAPDPDMEGAMLNHTT